MKNIFLKEETDELTYIQFDNCCEHPAFRKGALMPDAHGGYDAPIGSVIALKDWVVPSWIGYDIGCLDKDTEYLTPTGWKKINDYNNEDIMTYDVSSKIAFFDKPKAYIKEKCKEFNYLNNGVVNQMLSDEHKVLLFSSINKRTKKDGFIKDLIEKNRNLSKGINQQFKTTFDILNTNNINYSDEEIRLIVAIQADGHIRKSGRVEFHLVKKRKIERLKKLLKKNNLEYKLTIGINGSTYIYFNFNKATKELKFMWGANSKQLKILTSESIYWDGCYSKIKNRCYYSSVNKENIDIMQYAYATQGIRSNFAGTKQKEHHNICYQLYTTGNNFVNFPKKNNITRVKSVDGYKYCFTTSTGYFIIRRKGKIVITGNCGMYAVRLNIKKNEVNDLEELHKKLHAVVPCGNSIHSNGDLFNMVINRGSESIRQAFKKRKVEQQFGTLGGGNHFLELSYDDEDNVWIVVHSGSRGFGHEVATYWIKKQKEETCNLGWYSKSKEGKRYIEDMAICLNYALENRKMMILNTIKELEKNVGRNIEMIEGINRNHNHMDIAHGYHIHRKGATHAENGMFGVIPANMRDGAFIVKGLGNPNSLWSSSHGAGRKMSRTVANKTLSLETFKDQMKNVVGDVELKTLDESPNAYKNIHDIIDMQVENNIIEVVTHIKPFLNLKG